MSDTIRVSAPARLHFGLFSIGDRTTENFGGAGLMIDQPRTVVEISPADQLVLSCNRSSIADDVDATRSLRRTIERWFRRLGPILADRIEANDWNRLPVRLHLESAGPRHVGFGSGTQLALATVVALHRYLRLPLPSVLEMATLTGRGQRSAIGSHGFWSGGFLVDRGKAAETVVAPLDLRINFPTDWPIVTITAEHPGGLSGSLESQAFSRLPASTEKSRREMIQLVKHRIVPAITAHDYEAFGETLFEFGQRSGQMFASIQGGPFNGAAVEQAVKQIRQAGISAVGQSSWGPCVYAICPSEPDADRIAMALKNRFPKASIGRYQADNRGVQIEQSSFAEGSD